MKQVIIDRATGTVKHVTSTIVRETSLKEFIDNHSFGNGVNIPLLPSDCKGFIGTSTHTGFIIESLPATRNIKFKMYQSFNINERQNPFTNNIIEFNIHMPFIYWIIGVSNNPVIMQGTGICFAMERVISEESIVGLMKFPNVNKDTSFGNFPVGTFCLGQMQLDDDLDFATCTDRLISGLLCSIYNRDYFTPADAGWNIPVFKKAYDKYCNRDRLMEIVKAEEDIYKQWNDLYSHDLYTEAKEIFQMHSREHNIAQYILHPKDCPSIVGFKWMYAWEKLSEEISLEKFMEVWKLPKMTNYSNIVSHVQKLVDKITLKQRN